MLSHGERAVKKGEKTTSNKSHLSTRTGIESTIRLAELKPSYSE